MDHEDPIQQLLKNTGWSCDDLLQKLQRLQTQKDPVETQQQTPSQSKTNDVSDECGLRNDSEEITSTLDLNLNTSNVQKPQQSIHKISASSTKANDTFSDTDDEEQEVNATNTDIINEIIDDIYQTDEVKSSECNSEREQANLSDINNTEITEVRVIEVNEEDEAKDQVREENLVNPEEIQYLEGYLHNTDYETITIETEPEDQSKAVEKKIDYVEVHPRKRYKIVRSQKMLLPGMLQKKQISSPKLKLLSKTSGPSPENKIHNSFRRKVNPLNTLGRKFVIKKTIQKVHQWPKLPNGKTLRQYTPNPVVSAGHENTPKIVVSSNITPKTNTCDIDDLLPKTVISSKCSDRFPNKTVVISSNSSINKKSEDMEDVLPKTLISSQSANVCTTSEYLGSKEIPPSRLSKSSAITSSVVDSSLTTVVSSRKRELPKYCSLIADRIVESPKIKKIPLPNKSIVSDAKFRIETNRFRQNNVAVQQCPPKLLLCQPIVEERLKKAEEKSKIDLGTAPTSGLSGTLSRTEDSEDERVEEESINVNTEEDIRNNLKLQLNSLRTKKRSQFFDTITSTKLQNFECSRKLSLLASYESSNKEDTTAKASKDEPNSINESSIFEDHQNDLYTQTNELGLVILNVQGGIELDDFENDESRLQKTDTNEENTDNQIKKNDNHNKDNCDQRTDIDDTNSNSASDNEFNEEECRKADYSEQRVFDQIRKIINKPKHPLKLSMETKSHNVSCKTLTSTIDEELKMDASSVSGENSQSSFAVESAEIDENSVTKLTPTIGDGKKMDISSMSGENSQSSFPVESSAVEEKSPFVSDTLDEFLTASKLNISYQVPKLGAEEGVKNITEESPLVLKKVENVKEKAYGTKLKSIPTVKAKTVAQKRKLLERERKKELRREEHEKKMKELKEKVKQVHKTIKDIKMKKGIENKENKFKHNENRDKSYILFNDNKIWVRSRSPNKCIARIDCTREHRQKSETCQRKKWSLLKHQRKSDCKLLYRPGPMCKKQDLQISGNEKWESRMLKLPKILLEVAPKPGQPFCDTVLHRFANVIGGELDTNKIEFALSAVKSRNQIEDKKGQEPLLFPLEYHNKVDHALVRRSKKVTVNTEMVSCPIKSCEVKNSSDTVADVIEDLIKYVEIKELAPTLIKNDDTQIKVEDELIDSKLLSPVKDKISVVRKPNRKRSKIEYELLRLSCKVVNVDIDESADTGICNKPYCQLGCVCNSLKCEFILTRHCQKVACMFDCTCPAEKPLISDTLTFPAGTNVLSEESVIRIEDEAKRHLAKVERDFTQTVIHTSDKTIVVGIGDRTKTRRAAKVPAKFSDFVSSSNAICEESTYSKRCIVSLPKLNLSELIPYCLTHNVYSCHCKGLDLTAVSSERDSLQPHEWFEGRDTNTKIKIEQKSKRVRSDKSKRDAKAETKRFIMPDVIEMKNIKSDTENSSLDESWSPSKWVYSSISNVEDLSKRPTRNIKKRVLSEDYVDYNEQFYFISSGCARVRPVAKKYTKRSVKYHGNVFQDDFIFHIKESDLLRIKIQQDQDRLNIPVSEADLLKKMIVHEKLLHRANQPKDNEEKRKQTAEFNKQNILSANNKSFNENAAIQRRRKVPVQSRKSPEVKTVFEIKTVFDGEIIIDERNMDLLQKMGPKTVAEGYARLLPWTALISGYQNKSINIWSMIDQPSRLLINKAAKKCPKNYVNINESSQATEVILWIKKNKLPSHYQEDSLSFILRETKDNFEICGICTKNITFDETMSDRGEIFYHKDLNGVERFFILKKNIYRIMELAEVVPEHETSTLPQLRAALPRIFTICKWRMIYLNSDFTFLFFKGIPYSIRYKDLLAIGDDAKRNKCTIWLKNKEMQKHYNHKLFGIYFDPRFTDRIFIGPYFKDHKDNDVETLRYINQSLVSTESFNKMRGKGDYKCGHWLVETKHTALISLSSVQVPLPESVRSESPVSETSTCEPTTAEFMTDFLSESTIDLTSDGEEDSSEQRTISEISKHPSDTQEYYPFSPVIMHNNQEVKIIDAPPRTPEDFNRYIITNIPYFGYLGAYTHPTGEIDVSWPFENKLLRFCTETSATSFLQDRFSTLLQAVPETFKINIIVAVKIDLIANKPIDSRVLSGHYICGDFGYMSLLDINDEDCRSKVGVPKEEIMKLFSKRAQNFVKKKIETLSYLLQIKRNRAGGFNLAEVLIKAAEEIHLQIRKDKENKILKNALFLRKRDNAIKVHRLISALPIEQRNIENLKFRAILHKNEALPIEIQDSDDEQNKSDDADKVTTSETKPSTSASSTDNAEPLEVFKSPPPLSYITKSNSVLKKLVSVPIDAETALLMRADPKLSETDSDTAHISGAPDKLQYIKGVKLVKNLQGGFVLVNDANKNTEDLSNRTEVIIQDSKLFAVNNSSAPTSAKLSVTNFDHMSIGEAIIIDLDKDSGRNGEIPEVTLTSSDAVEINELSAESVGKAAAAPPAGIIDLDDSAEVNETEDDDDVIHIENEPMIIDLDEIPSDDDSEPVKQQSQVVINKNSIKN